MSLACIRRPVVAGYYYPAEAGALARAVDAACPPDAVPQRVAAAVVPHGSLPRAGQVIGATLARIQMPSRCVIIGASHTDTWKTWSLMRDGAYQTPLGEVPVDVELAGALQRACPFLASDLDAHRGEHAVEVLLPFLQRLAPAGLTIVPIVVGVGQPEESQALGLALAQCAQRDGPLLCLASTDLSHFEPDARARELDRALLQCLERLDAAGLAQVVEERAIAMCGEPAARCVVEAARALGATHGIVAGYRTSAEAGGDAHAVTGYGGVLMPEA